MVSCSSACSCMGEGEQHFPLHFLFPFFRDKGNILYTAGTAILLQPVSGFKALWLSAERVFVREGWRQHFILGSTFSSQSFSGCFTRWYLRPSLKSRITFWTRSSWWSFMARAISPVRRGSALHVAVRGGGRCSRILS